MFFGMSPQSAGPTEPGVPVLAEFGSEQVVT
jgi:hypothetical protein